MRILELGNYIIPAYAGMLLAEQGHRVEKWTNGKDPILALHRGDELWDWINYKKKLLPIHFEQAPSYLGSFDIVIDNLTPSALARYGLDPDFLANKFNIRWVSMRSEVGERSFDIIAQARSIMEYCDWVPFYLGDTSGGLWLAFKAMANNDPGHYVLGQASVLQKLVEGELLLTPKRERHKTPWDVSRYGPDGKNSVSVDYKGSLISEPVRDSEWKLDNLWHKLGRISV